MATTYSATLAVNLQAALAATTGGQSSSASLPLAAALATLLNGTGANKTNQMWYSQRTLAATVNETLDVYAPGTDAFGASITMATVKILIIQNTATVEADTLSIGGTGSTAGWTSFLANNSDILIIPGGGALVAVAPGATGYVVGASTTNHSLKVLNNSASNSVIYNIWIIGATA